MDKRHYIDRRIRRLNDLGFDVAEMQIQRSPDGDTVTFVPKVVDAGHHQRQLLRLTGLDAEENQARSLLNDLETWMATQDDYAPGDPLGARPEVLAHRWVRRCLPAHRAGGPPGAARRHWTPRRSTTNCWNTAGCCPSGPGVTWAWKPPSRTTYEPSWRTGRHG